MAFVVEDGTGLANATSLVSVARADEILSARLHTSAWTSLTGGGGTTTKEAALQWMSRILSRLDWQGVRRKDTQALAFPRSWLQKRDPVSATPYLPGDPSYYAETAVPDFVEEACAVGALRLVQRDPMVRPDVVGFTQMQAGPLSLTIDQDAISLDRDDVLDREVLDIIDFALLRSSKGIAKPAVRV